MPYAATVTVTPIGQKAYRVTIAEVDCGPTDEAQVPGLPVQGAVRRQLSQKGAGTAATIDPIVGIATNPSGNDVIVENDVPTTQVDVQGFASYLSATGTLFHRSRPNAGNDNVVTTVYHITTGW